MEEIIKLTPEEENALQRVEIDGTEASVLSILDVLEIDKTDVTNIELRGNLSDGTTLTIWRNSPSN